MGRIMPDEELYLQIRTANYIRTNYPGVLFNSDMSGFRLPIWLAKIAKQLRSQRGWPDMSIPEPRKGFAGMYLELKVDSSDVYKKDGALRNTQHIQEQNQILEMLRERGFWADFVCGDDQAREIIDWYLLE